MTAFEISELGSFMAKLLKTPLFDNFLLVEATVQTSVTFHIDGQLHPEFFSEEECTEKGLTDCPCAPFSLVRETCFSMIKGRNTPVSFQFIFQLSPENAANTLAKSRSGFTPEDITGMFINLNYKNRKLTATTGISYKTFTLEKTLEKEWDALVEKFLQINQVQYASIV